MSTIINSFKYAFQGIKDALKSEPNLRFHFLVAIGMLTVALFLNFNMIEFTILLITICLIISLELINTVFEKVVDLHSTKISEEARVIKDISAGIVLIGSIISVIVGIFLFLPKILFLI